MNTRSYWPKCSHDFWQNEEDVKQGDYFPNIFQGGSVRATCSADVQYKTFGPLHAFITWPAHSESEWEVAAWHITNLDAKSSSQNKLCWNQPAIFYWLTKGLCTSRENFWFHTGKAGPGIFRRGQGLGHLSFRCVKIPQLPLGSHQSIHLYAKVAFR